MFKKRVTGIEPVSSAWKAEVLPLHNTRTGTSEPSEKEWPVLQHSFIMTVRRTAALA